MRKIYYILLLTLSIFPFKVYAIEDKIPSGSTYMGIKTDNQVHYLLKNLLINNYTMILYPDGKKEVESPFYLLINTLKKEGTKYIELFSNPQWGILIKVDVKNYDNVIKTFNTILREEGFMPKITKNTKSKVIIASESPAFEGNYIYLLKEKGKLIISNSQPALIAWEKRSVSIEYKKEIETMMTKPQSPLFFSYEHNNSMLSDDTMSPFFLALYNTQKNPRLLDATAIFKSSEEKPLFPSFIKERPLFLLPTSVNQFTRSASSVQVEAIRMINNIALTQKPYISQIYTVMNNGDIFSFNEKKYDAIDAFIAIQSKEGTISQLENAIKNLPAIQSVKINGQNLYKIIPRNRMDMPISALVYGNSLIFSYNRNALTSIAKTKLSPNKARKIELNVEISTILEKFPIVSSLASQYALNIKNVHSLLGYQEQSLNINIKSQSFTLKLK